MHTRTGKPHLLDTIPASYTHAYVRHEHKCTTFGQTLRVAQHYNLITKACMARVFAWPSTTSHSSITAHVPFSLQ